MEAWAVVSIDWECERVRSVDVVRDMQAARGLVRRREEEIHSEKMLMDGEHRMGVEKVRVELEG